MTFLLSVHIQTLAKKEINEGLRCEINFKKIFVSILSDKNTNNFLPDTTIEQLCRRRLNIYCGQNKPLRLYEFCYIYIYIPGLKMPSMGHPLLPLTS